MDDNDWDLNSILYRFKASTFTPPTPPIETPTPPPQTPITNSPQMTTTPSIDEAFPFTISQENDPFPFTQPNPNDFLELDQLLMDFINPTTFTNTTTTTITDTITDTSGHGINPNSTFSDLSDLIGQQQMMSDHGLYDLVAPPTTYTPIPTTYTPIEPPTNTFNTFYHQYQQQLQPQQRQQQEPYYQLPVQVPQINSTVSPNTQPQPQQAPKSRRRRGQETKNVQKMTRENLFNDVWAWRKYGQKVIKGSPYPRHYFKCSSLKGCEARKHVEKSTTDEDMFNVTFVGKHNHAKPTHRNSLSGTTRRKSSATRLPAAIETGSLLYTETGSPSNSVFPPPIMLQFDKPDNGVAMVAAGEPKIPDVEMEPYDNDILIPNLQDAMSDAFLFDFDPFYGGGNGGVVPSIGSDPNSSTGFNPVRF